MAVATLGRAPLRALPRQPRGIAMHRREISVASALAVALGLGACLSRPWASKGHDADRDDGSVLASIPGIDADLSRASDLTYRLLCGPLPDTRLDETRLVAQ